MRRKFSVFVLLILVVQASTTFVCDDGNFLDNSWLNDDYCDCADGTDEPATSACPNGLFKCRDTRFDKNPIPASRVQDGICDCCDGSDELFGTCPNDCGKLAEAERTKLLSQLKEIKLGLAAREYWVVLAQESLTQLQLDFIAAEAELEVAEADVKAAVEAAERAEQEAEEIRKKQAKAIELQQKQQEQERPEREERDKVHTINQANTTSLTNLTSNSADFLDKASTASEKNKAQAAAGGVGVEEESADAAAVHFPYPSQYRAPPSSLGDPALTPTTLPAPRADEKENFPYPEEFRFPGKPADVVLGQFLLDPQRILNDQRALIERMQAGGLVAAEARRVAEENTALEAAPRAQKAANNPHNPDEAADVGSAKPEMLSIAAMVEANKRELMDKTKDRHKEKREKWREEKRAEVRKNAPTPQAPAEGGASSPTPTGPVCSEPEAEASGFSTNRLVQAWRGLREWPEQIFGPWLGAGLATGWDALGNALDSLSSFCSASYASGWAAAIWVGDQAASVGMSLWGLLPGWVGDAVADALAWLPSPPRVAQEAWWVIGDAFVGLRHAFAPNKGSSKPAGARASAAAKPTGVRDAERVRDEHRASVQALRAQLAADYGPDQVYAKLLGSCAEYQVGQYTYEGSMLFEGGSKCFKGPARSLEAHFVCASQHAVLDVQEPSQCVYTMRIGSPAACSVQARDAIQDKLDTMGL